MKKTLLGLLLVGAFTTASASEFTSGVDGANEFQQLFSSFYNSLKTLFFIAYSAVAIVCLMLKGQQWAQKMLFQRWRRARPKAADAAAAEQASQKL